MGKHRRIDAPFSSAALRLSYLVTFALMALATLLLAIVAIAGIRDSISRELLTRATLVLVPVIGFNLAVNLLSDILHRRWYARHIVCKTKSP